MDGMDGWMDGWLLACLVGWLVGWLDASSGMSQGGLAPNAGEARDAGDARNTGASASDSDAGSAAGLLRFCSVLGLQWPRTAMMHQRRWAHKATQGVGGSDRQSEGKA